ncbi:MAG: tetratricopeptide repeat protein [Planctomycetes bacterium]|nr:tetratricopeptide repeat protein [Planctomycetota bacterium]
MTPHPYDIDPEVEAILQEVARDPQSSLLRIERPRVIRGLLEREPTVGVATAGLTLAERHLVQTRRAETAFALRVMCINALEVDPRNNQILTNSSAGERAKWPSQLENFKRSWSADQESVREALADEFPAVRESFAVRHPRGLPILDLLSVSQRLEPTDGARINGAVWMLLGRQTLTSLHVIHGVLAYPTPAYTRATALVNLGLTYHMLGDLSASLASYTSAAEVSPGYISAVASRFAVAAQLGRKAQFMHAAAQLEDCATLAAPDFVSHCALQMRVRPDFAKSLCSEGARLLSQSRDQLGPVARALADVLV